MERLDTISNPFGGQIWYRQTTTSTMLDAELLLAGEQADGSLVMAGFQSAGQGRFSTRRWEAGPEQSLLFTLVIPPGLASPVKPGFGVSLTLALGLCHWLEGLGLTPAIKWPNDILLGDQKLAGILVTGTKGRYLAGIGINLAQEEFVESAFRRPASSLHRHGISLTPRQALPQVLASLMAALGLPDPREAVESRLWHLHQSHEMTTSPEGPPIRGMIAGLDDDGALLLDTALGRQRLVSGE